MPKSRSKAPAAIEMLIADHDKVKKAFKEFATLERDDGAARRELVQSVCHDLKTHTTLEEEILYPALREALPDQDLLNEAAVEHETAKMLIEQLESMEPDDASYHATFTVLGEYVKHHIEEEEGEMFPQARKSEINFEALGERMRKRKDELMADPAREHA